MEIRQAQITASETTPKMNLEGYAVVFDAPAQIGGGYEEIIQRGALSETDLNDVVLFYNHDVNRIPLARTPQTLKLEVDERGLKFTAELPPTEEGRAVYESVKRGDLRGCSFAFNISDDTFEGKRRVIRKIDKIFECSICTFPAYSQTSVQARNLNNLKLEAKTMTTENQIQTQNEVYDRTQTENQTFGDNAKTLFRNVAGFTAAKTFDAENILDSAEYRSAFFKKLQGKELTTPETTAFNIAQENFAKRASEFNTATNSAALIPTQTLNEIISKARTQGGLLAECRAFSIPSNVAIPVATPATRASWHAEGAAVDSEKISTETSVTFAGNEIIKIFSMSLKAQAMTISAFESYLIDELRNSVLDTIEYSLLNGTGEGEGKGLMSIFDSDNTVAYSDTSVVSGQTTTTARNINYSMIAQAISKLKRGYANGAKFAMNNRTLWMVFYHLEDGSNRPLFIQDLQNESIGKILGFPVIIDDNIADGDVIFGNFKYMAYNLPQGIMIETSRESSFKSGLIDYRAIAIADTKPLLKEAFVLLSQNLQS